MKQIKAKNSYDIVEVIKDIVYIVYSNDKLKIAFNTYTPIHSYLH